MTLISYLTDGKAGDDQMNHLIYEGGIVIFVLIALIGSVMIDYMLSGFPASGKRVFKLYIIPLLILLFVIIEFLLLCFKAVEKNIFNVTSYTTIIVFLFSISYYTFIKAELYQKEDLKTINLQKQYLKQLTDEPETQLEGK